MLQIKFKNHQVLLSKHYYLAHLTNKKTWYLHNHIVCSRPYNWEMKALKFWTRWTVTIMPQSLPIRSWLSGKPFLLLRCSGNSLYPSTWSPYPPTLCSWALPQELRIQSLKQDKDSRKITILASLVRVNSENFQWRVISVSCKEFVNETQWFG